MAEYIPETFSESAIRRLSPSDLAAQLPAVLGEMKRTAATSRENVEAAGTAAGVAFAGAAAVPPMVATDVEGGLYELNARLAPGWDDLVVSAQGVNPPGGVDAVVQNNTESTVDFTTGATSRRVDVTYQMPHAADPTEMRLHLHTYRSADPGAGKVARFTIRWRVANEGEAKPAWVEGHVVLAAVPPGTGPGVVPLGTYTAAGAGISSCYQFQITRTPSHADDTCDADLQVYSMDAHVRRVRPMGSPNEFSL